VEREALKEDFKAQEKPKSIIFIISWGFYLVLA